MITKIFGRDFDSPGGALTLPQDAVTVNGEEGGTHTRTHESGWTITGRVHEDYYVWVNEFRAHHPEYGEISGNFEAEVTAESEVAFAHFMEHHPPYAWDYMDI